MKASLELLRARPNAELIWASPRELFNVFQADEIGCHIITVTNDILKKLSLRDKDLTSSRSRPSTCSTATRKQRVLDLEPADGQRVQGTGSRLSDLPPFCPPKYRVGLLCQSAR